MILNTTKQGQSQWAFPLMIKLAITIAIIWALASTIGCEFSRNEENNLGNFGDHIFESKYFKLTLPEGWRLEGTQSVEGGIMKLMEGNIDIGYVECSPFAPIVKRGYFEGTKEEKEAFHSDFARFHPKPPDPSSNELFELERTFPVSIDKAIGQMAIPKYPDIGKFAVRLSGFGKGADGQELKFYLSVSRPTAEQLGKAIAAAFSIEFASD